MKYLIYIAIAVLVLWSVWYLIRHIRGQARGQCGSCGGGCAGCTKACGRQHNTPG